MVTEAAFEDGAAVVHIKSLKSGDECPRCGARSSRAHSSYIRQTQDTPFHGIPVWLRVEARRFHCDNPGCECGTFAEKLDFAGRSQIRTDFLTLMAMEIARYLGNETADKVLERLGAKMSNDTITRIYHSLRFEDDEDVEAVGIDDVSNRRGRTYFTVVYDLKTHRLLDLLEGRDGSALKAWLERHRKVNLVMRDRASAYAEAVSEVLPNAAQVADRFHLINNCMDHLIDHARASMPGLVAFSGGLCLGEAPAKEPFVPKPADLTAEALSKLASEYGAPPAGGEAVEFDDKNRRADTPTLRKQAEARRKKQDLIREMQEFKAQNPEASFGRIAAQFNSTPPTAKKYLKMGEEEIKALDCPKAYKPRESLASDYGAAIYRMLSDKKPWIAIYWCVRELGCDACAMALLRYMDDVEKNNFPERKSKSLERLAKMGWPDGIEAFSRGDLLSYVLTCNPKTEKDPKVGAAIDEAKKAYPALAFADEAFHAFHGAIMGDSPEALDDFLAKYDKNPILKGFCDKIKRDIEPVRNAISHSESSGFVEGCNNKFKLLKRILYGRAKFVNLKLKAMFGFAADVPTCVLLGIYGE
jgi:transposase